MKLKLCINVHDISLYINCILFIVVAHVLSLLWQLKVSIHIIIMGNVEIGIYFCVTADIMTKVLLKCFWSSPLSTIRILSKSLILTGGYGNRKAKFSKKTTTKHSKIFFSEAIRRMKLKLCINVYDISLYIKCISIAVAHVFSLLWQLKVSIDL